MSRYWDKYYTLLTEDKRLKIAESWHVKTHNQDYVYNQLEIKPTHGDIRAYLNDCNKFGEKVARQFLRHTDPYTRDLVRILLRISLLNNQKIKDRMKLDGLNPHDMAYIGIVHLLGDMTINYGYDPVTDHLKDIGWGMVGSDYSNMREKDLDSKV